MGCSTPTSPKRTRLALHTATASALYDSVTSELVGTAPSLARSRFRKENLSLAAVSLIGC